MYCTRGNTRYVTARTTIFRNGDLLQAIPYLIDLQIT